VPGPTWKVVNLGISKLSSLDCDAAGKDHTWLHSAPCPLERTNHSKDGPCPFATTFLCQPPVQQTGTWENAHIWIKRQRLALGRALTQILPQLEDDDTTGTQQPFFASERKVRESQRNSLWPGNLQLPSIPGMALCKTPHSRRYLKAQIT
jgi:hypothetical protein